jgi:hypothetical protein
VTAVTRPRPAWPAALLLAASFGAGLGLYTRHAGMPYYYHSDEPSKVEQVTGDRPLNFKHPLLLMNATRALAHATGADAERQAAVRAGRTASAAFAAATVAALGALAWLAGGPLAAACVAPVVLLSHGLFTFAHFMKEDTAVAFGLSAVLLAASAFAARASRGRALALGVACALAISGKYVGAVALALALPLVASRARRGARGAGAAFALGLGAALALVNVSILLDPSAFRAGLAYETDHVATGGGRPFAGLRSAAYLHGLLSQTVWPVRILAVGAIAWVLASWRRRSFAERLLAAAPLAYLVLLQASPIKAIRYLLPVVVVLHALAGLAIARLAAHLGGGRPLRRAALALLLLAPTLALEAREVRLHLGEFASESRLALYRFVRDELPAESAILQDRYAGLPDPSEGYSTPDQPYLPQLVLTRHHAVDEGTLAELRARGIEYVAVCERIYERFFQEDRRFGDAGARERFERRRARYAELFAEGTLVFEAGASRIAGAPVNPVVKVYRLTPRAAPARLQPLAEEPLVLRHHQVAEDAALAGEPQPRVRAVREAGEALALRRRRLGDGPLDRDRAGAAHPPAAAVERTRDDRVEREPRPQQHHPEVRAVGALDAAAGELDGRHQRPRRSASSPATRCARVSGTIPQESESA